MRRTKKELIPSLQSTFPSSSSSADTPWNLSSDTVFWFLDENYPSSGNDQLFSNATSSEHSVGGTVDSSLVKKGEDELNDEGNPDINHEDRTRAFWEEQEQLLLSILRRTTTTEYKIRQVTKEALREYNSISSSSSSSSSSNPSPCCHQPSPIIKSGITTTSSSRYCNNCLRKEMVCQRLRDAGYTSFIRKSKWKSSSEIPSGEHTYLEVEVNKPIMKVIIEINFKSEFEMERAGKEYHKRLVSHLPEVFVGKPERLKILLKILCDAAKKCIKEKGLYLGPWRKHKYMQSKWMLTNSSTTSSLKTTVSCDVPMGRSNRPAVKPKSSMLTFVLQVDRSNNLRPRQAAVAVV